MNQTRGRTAVVTGAASGIGLALSRRFAADGMKVVMADVERAALEKAAAGVRESGADVLDVVTDVSDFDQVAALAAAASEAFGHVHVLCNNAGVAAGGPIAELSLDDWRWVLDVNLFGVIHGLKAFLPGMIAHGEEGHVVNTASVAGLVSPPMMAPYNASKFAVVAISESLHHELALSGSRVKVSVLCPGWVNTRIHEAGRNRPASRGAAPEPDPEDPRRQMMAAVIASGLDPAEVAGQVAAAIAEERLYVLTHPDMVPAVENRMRDIAAQRNPVFTGLFA